MDYQRVWASLYTGQRQRGRNESGNTVAVSERDRVGTEKKLTLHGDSVLLGDSVIHNYRFCENYYFVSGDKMVNSKDSRYWGLLPEPFIVGRAWLVWKSVSPNTGKMRWKRIFKRID